MVTCLIGAYRLVEQTAPYSQSGDIASPEGLVLLAEHTDHRKNLVNHRHPGQPSGHIYTTYI